MLRLDGIHSICMRCKIKNRTKIRSPIPSVAGETLLLLGRSRRSSTPVVLNIYCSTPNTWNVKMLEIAIQLLTVVNLSVMIWKNTR